MPVIKVKDISHVRLSAPDLDRMEQFLTDFGMQRAARTDTALYMRGMGTKPFIHVTEKGPPGFIGFAYGARSLQDLQTLAEAHGATVEAIDEPGGGSRVRLREPNGFQIDVLYGQQPVQALPDTVARIRPPDGASMRKGAPRVTRIAHAVLATPKLNETIAWFRENFGFIQTDELFLADDRMIGSFNRIDDGMEPVDHHVIFCINNPNAGMHHASFEVMDPNDIFIGHDHLTKAGYEHIRGVSRHALGSQIFDYWVSPFDQMHELWNSAEQFNVESAYNKIPIGPGLAHDHGPPPSERFVKQSTPAPAKA